MGAISTSTDFIVWGIDHTTYGPVELPTLVAWVKDERVTADTWLFVGKTASWQKAGELPELQLFFSKLKRPTGGVAVGPRGIDVRALRRVKILASLSDEQLDRFAQFVEAEPVAQWTVIVKQGDPGDSMYLILEGELRVRIHVGGTEKILTTLGAGEFFGDISLFDQGPRSADVVANADSLLVKITAAGFEEVAKAAPDLATPFLRAVGRTLSARIRADNKRFSGSVQFGQVSE
jgi:CRP/FNR family transcriptional regulator, cyclic AMP receptor protein